MKKLLILLVFVCSAMASAQKMELTPRGFAPAEFRTPARPMEILIETAKGWASIYNRKGFDVYEVTGNSLKIDAEKLNAFFYRNLGEKYVFRIKYTLAIEFTGTTYKVTFSIREIRDSDDKVIESTIGDYFTSEGKLKEDFEEVKPSLEYTVNGIVSSFADYMTKSN